MQVLNLNPSISSPSFFIVWFSNVSVSVLMVWFVVHEVEGHQVCKVEGQSDFMDFGPTPLRGMLWTL